MSDRDDFDNFSKKNKYSGYEKYDARFDYKYPTSSRTSPNRRENEYEGVEYVPSGDAQRRSAQKGGTRSASGTRNRPSADSRAKYGGRSGPPQSAQSKRKMKSQSQSAVFIAAIVGVGVLLCFGAFLLMFNLMKPSPIKTSEPVGNETPANENPGDTNTDSAAVVESDSEMTGIIKSISNGTVSLVNFDDDKQAQIFVNQDTRFRNKYGQAMTMAQFGEGDIVIAEYSSLTKQAQVLRLDPEAWVKSTVKNIEINSGTTTVKIGNDTLTLSPETLFLPSGTDSTVKLSDVVTLKGRKSKIMAVVVEKRSGTIEFKNKEKITDGTVEVDADIYKALEETGSLKVSTGEHTVVVKGVNIEVFIKEITIREGETVVIDLDEAQVKEGIVNLTVNEPDYTLLVNDEQIARSNEPLKLPFGAYKLKITKEGYTSWEGNVTVNQPSVSVNATLTAEVKMGTVTVNITDPPGLIGNVYIDNALIGSAPVNRASVTYGTHQLTVKAPGYVDTSTPIIVEGDVTYNVTMHKTADNVNNAGTGEPGINDTAGTLDTIDYDPTR